MITAAANGAVTLYHDDSPVALTTAGGFSTSTGMNLIVGDNAHLTMGDDQEIRLGDSSDIKFKHHNSGYGHLENTGILYVDAEQIILRTDNSSIGNALTLDASHNATFAGTITSGGDLFVDAASGNPSLTLKTAGTGNNPHVNYRAGNNIVFDNMLVASASTDYWRVGFGTSGSVGTEVLAVTTGSRVGINNTDPDYVLDVQGSGGDVAIFRGDANNTIRAYLGSGYQIFQAVNSGTTSQFGYGPSGFYIQTNGSNTALTVDSNQRVLIGLTSNFAHAEGDDLQIGDGTGDHGITFNSGQDGRSSIFFGNAGTNGNVDGAIRYFHETYSTTSVRRGIGVITGNTTRGFLSNGNGQMIWGDTAATTPNYPGSITAHRTGSSTTTTQSTWSFNGTANGSNKDYGFKVSGAGAYAYGVLNAAETTWMSRMDFNGAIHLTNTTVQSISDRRLKKEIVDANSQWDDIKALQFKNFKWKDEAKGKETYLGLIADEVESVSPSLVGVDAVSAETIPEDGKDPEYKNVKYSIVWMKSVIALQEAMAKIEQLEEKVKALEEG
jgi:hypothetical protein